ncbi:MAG: PAS domain S-box protein [Dehalococcoidia bacterium]|nr:PAS domain S-box protein [Dehalococcoidia bacterium]
MESTTLQKLATALALKLDEISGHNRVREAGIPLPDLYRTIFDNTGTMICVTDNHGLVALVNRQFENVLGYKREDIEGTLGWEALFPAEDVLKMQKVRNRRLSGDPSVPHQYEARLVAANGAIIPVLKTSTLIPCSEFILTSFMDMTQEKQAQKARCEAERRAQQSQRLASVGRMAAGVAHEINNPVTGIIGFADLLLKQDLTEDCREYAKGILEAGQRVAGIVQQLLASARWTSPAREPVSVNMVVESALRRQHLPTSDGAIQITTDLDLAPQTILGNESQLEQCFRNILANAETEIRLSNGRGHLRIATTCDEDNVVVTFEDDGPGILPEHMDRIFDPFFTTREIGQGTGLGLTICHSIVSEHEGKIRAANNARSGATLTVELPILKETAYEP